MPEFAMSVMVIVFLLVAWGIPLAAGVWALLTLQRIRKGQEAADAKLEAIERLLRQP